MTLQMIDLQGFLFFVCQICVAFFRFLPLFLTQIRHIRMTHEITGTRPAHLKGKLVRNCAKKALKNPRLTHDLTHEMTHAFGSSFSSEMAVLTRIVTKFKNQIFLHFDTLFHTPKKVCQIPARTLTLAPCMACSLNPDLFTAKTPTL
jgi:hypothetical protein